MAGWIPAFAGMTSWEMARTSAYRPLFGEWQRFASRQANLEHIERVRDQRVVADDADHLDEPGFAERGDRLVEALIRQAPCAEDLAADAMDERFVLGGEQRRAVGADRLDRRAGHAGLLGERGMRIPFVLGAPEPGGADDCQLGKPVRQRGAPAQMLAELRGEPANLGRPDQELEGAAEPAALASDDLIMHALLRRAHLGRGNLAVTAHGWVPLFIGLPS